VLAIALPQNADEHRSQHSILLAIDQEFGEGAALWVCPELADPLGSFEVGEYEDVEQLRTETRPNGVESLAQYSFELREIHEGERQYPGGTTSRQARGRSSGVGPYQVSGGRSQGSKRRWTKASPYCDSHLCWISSCTASCSQART
jgi:hypothetical protein